LKEKAAGVVKEVAVLTRQVKYLSNDQVVHDILSTSLAIDIEGFQEDDSRRCQGDRGRLFQR
jgi:hypothetical protein